MAYVNPAGVVLGDMDMKGFSSTGSDVPPPGLEALAAASEFTVDQQVSLLEVVTGWEVANKYRILDSNGQQIYFAAEDDSKTCMRQMCGEDRAFTINITDVQKKEVMRVRRELEMCKGCCCLIKGDRCARQCSVEGPPDVPVAHVRQLFSWWTPKFEILDASNQRMFTVQGPCCICQAACCPGDVVFYIRDTQGTEVGTIAKEWTGCCQETYSNADRFKTTFTTNVDVKKKMAILGAVFFLDFLEFEEDHDDNNHSN